MNQKEMLNFAKEQRQFFEGEMRDFLDSVITTLSRVSNKPDADLVGARIRIAMQKKGINQRILSKKTDLSEQCISRYVNGQRVPNTECIGRLSIALEVPPGYFYGVETSETSKRK